MRCDASGVRAGALPRIASAAPDGAGGTAAAGAAAAGSAARAPAASTTPSACLEPVISFCGFGRRGDFLPVARRRRPGARYSEGAERFLKPSRDRVPTPLLAVDRRKPTKEDR